MIVGCQGGDERKEVQGEGGSGRCLKVARKEVKGQLRVRELIVDCQAGGERSRRGQGIFQATHRYLPNHSLSSHLLAGHLLTAP